MSSELKKLLARIDERSSEAMNSAASLEETGDYKDARYHDGWCDALTWVYPSLKKCEEEADRE